MVRRLNEGFDIPKVDVNGFSYRDAKKSADFATRHDGYSNAVLLWPDGSFTITRTDNDGNPVGWEPKGSRLLYISKSDWSGGVHKAIGTEIPNGGVVLESRRPKTNKKSMKESFEPDAGPIEVWNVNKGKIEAEYEDAVEEAMTYIGSDETVPTWHWNIGEDEDNYYAIVLGFSEERDLMCKWAYIAKNSAMNDYAWDYKMPYDSDTGDVWDSEQSVDDGYGDVDYLLDDFKRYADQRNSEWDEFADDLYGVDDDDFDEDDLEYESIRLKRESTNKRRPTSKRKRNK